jgi:CIC family chloride channel protein
VKPGFFENLSTRISSRTYDLIEKAKMTEHTLMIIVAIIIGVMAGFAAILIRLLIREISSFAFPGDLTLLENIISSPWYLIIIIPAIGGLIVGPLINKFAPEAKGHGVPEVMQAILLRGGVIRPRVAFIKTIASAVTIGTGGSVGREGPIIQIGSSLGSMIGQILRMPANRLKTLVGCGAAAGIAAAFNAPIAGALFAVEIILMDFTVSQFTPIVISSVVATVISHTFEGNEPAFAVPAYQLVSVYELIFYFILGIVSGVVSYLFIKVLYFFEDFFDYKLKFPDNLKPALGGLILGAVALYFPHIMGTGYDTISSALYSNLTWYLALSLVFVKMFATSLTLGSGGSGGIFSPSLFIGVSLGSFLGSVLNIYFPEITATPGAYALVAMGGLLAGATRAPLTAIIMVFELTKDYNIILPLMITCVISNILSSRLSHESIYTLKLLRRNIGIKEGIEVNVMNSIFVREVFRKHFDYIKMKDNFSQIVNHIIKGKYAEYPVVDDEKNVRGIISIHDIKDYLYEREALQHVLVASDIVNTDFETLKSTDNCNTALDKLRKYDLEGLPVNDGKNVSKIIGMIWRKDIQDAYQKEIERREITSNFASRISMKEEQPQISFMEGYSIAEISPPKTFTGKSLRQLDIRAKYGIEVLSVKTREKGEDKIKAIPGSDYIIKESDILVIAGEIKNINIIRNIP